MLSIRSKTQDSKSVPQSSIAVTFIFLFFIVVVFPSDTKDLRCVIQGRWVAFRDVQTMWPRSPEKLWYRTGVCLQLGLV